MPSNEYKQILMAILYNAWNRLLVPIGQWWLSISNLERERDNPRGKGVWPSAIWLSELSNASGIHHCLSGESCNRKSGNLLTFIYYPRFFCFFLPNATVSFLFILENTDTQCMICTGENTLVKLSYHFFRNQTLFITLMLINNIRVKTT